MEKRKQELRGKPQNYNESSTAGANSADNGGERCKRLNDNVIETRKTTLCSVRRDDLLDSPLLPGNLWFNVYDMITWQSWIHLVGLIIYFKFFVLYIHIRLNINKNICCGFNLHWGFYLQKLKDLCQGTSKSFFSSVFSKPYVPKLFYCMFLSSLLCTKAS